MLLLQIKNPARNTGECLKQQDKEAYFARKRKESDSMDLLKETAPFLIGFIVPPILIFIRARTWPGLLKFTTAFLSAVILGTCVSALAGELAVGMPDELISVLIDTSLVYAGSQVAYWIIWKPVLEERLQRRAETLAERVSE
jgi:hypothetical protein